MAASTVTIQSTGTSYFPAGVTFGTKYVPLSGTYVEQKSADKPHL